jgi:zinc and cadmium transporter
MVDSTIWFYSIVSVFIISLIAFVGLLGLSVKVDKLRKVLIYLVSFSAGALFGDAFFHLLPHLVEENGFSFLISSMIILGIAGFFALEKIVHWQHCHMPITKGHVHEFALMNLVGDGLHNFIDGLIIGVSYLVSIPVGIATTVAVGLHEIPQEIGDFGVLVHGGFSRTKALFVNFMTALTAVVGVVVALIASQYFELLEVIVVPIAVGGFIYIAGSDLIPELHKHQGFSKGILQLIAFIAGVVVMVLLLGFEGH